MAENKQGLLIRAADALAALRGDSFTSLNLREEKSGAVYPGYSYGGGYGGSSWDTSGDIQRAVDTHIARYRGSQIDYAREVGDPLQSSLVAAAVNFVGVTLPEASPEVIEPTLTDKKKSIWAPVEDHPLIDLLNNPNPYYTVETMCEAFAASHIVYGNSYWWKIRNGLGQVIQLWPLCPAWVYPVWKDENSFIDFYEYRVNGQYYPLLPQDVVHFRRSLDVTGRMGVSPLMSVFREIFGDNEAANMAAVIMKNLGIFPFIVSPKDGVTMAGMSPEDKKALKDEFVRRTSGDERGKPFVNTIGLQVEKIAFSPAEMDITALRRVPEERVAAAIGIPGIVLGFGGAWDKSNYSNYGEAREQAYESYIVPLQRSMAATITKHLLQDEQSKFLTSDKQKVRFNYSDVRVLQEDRDALFTRNTTAYKGGWMKRSEARESAGLDVTPEDDAYFVAPPNPLGGQDNPNQGGDGQTPPKKDHAHEVKSVEFEGMRLSRRPTELELRIGFKDVAKQQDKHRLGLLAILLLLRKRLTKVAAKMLAKMSTAEFHTLVLEVAKTERASVVKLLEDTYKQGRQLVASEIQKQDPQALTPESGTAPEALLDEIEVTKSAEEVIGQTADATITRTVNSIQAMAVGSAAAGVVQGLSGKELADRVELDLENASEAPYEAYAGGAVNASLNDGRDDEAEVRQAQIEFYEYSAINDANLCGACQEADGERGATLDDVTAVPNVDCEGRDRCRCFVIYVVNDITDGEDG